MAQALVMAVKVKTKKAGKPVADTTSLPSTPEEWLQEIARAYLDAADTMLVDPEIKERDLFHLGPAVAIKFRGFKASKKMLKAATEATLTSYVATTGQDPEALGSPYRAFAFCYLTAHFGVDLLKEDQVGDLMDFIVEQERKLVKTIRAGTG